MYGKEFVAELPPGMAGAELVAWFVVGVVAVLLSMGSGTWLREWWELREEKKQRLARLRERWAGEYCAERWMR